MNLTDKYRPKNFNEVIGHFNTVRALRHRKDWKTLLFYGPPGVGKTSFARVVSMWMNCSEQSEDHIPCGKCSKCQSILRATIDYREENVGDSRGIDAMRNIIDWLRIRPIELKRKILVLDEVQQLLSTSQNLLLKVLEEPPVNTTIILCTTNVDGLIEPVVQRCVKFRLDLVPKEILLDLLIKVVEKEQIELTSEQVEELILKSNGSPRQLLMFLEVVRTGGKISDFSEDEVILKELFMDVFQGRVLSVTEKLSGVLKQFTPEEVLGRIVGYFKAMIRNSKNKQEIILLYAMLKELLESQTFHMIDRDGKMVVGVVGATIVADSLKTKPSPNTYLPPTN